MHYLTENWSFDPFLIIALILAGWHEVGLARLARKSRSERTRERRLRSLWFYAGLVVLLIAAIVAPAIMRRRRGPRWWTNRGGSTGAGTGSGPRDWSQVPSLRSP